MTGFFSALSTSDIQSIYLLVSLITYIPLLIIVRQQGTMSKMFKELEKKDQQLQSSLDMIKKSLS